MTNHQPPGLFITGTGTGIGKTVVAVQIVRWLVAAGLRVGVYKPVASGCGDDQQSVSASDDDQQLWLAAGQPGDFRHVCPQRFRAPLAPHLAARKEGKEIDRSLLRDGIRYWRERSDFVIVEGAGGLLSPISDDESVADLALDLGYPLVVVAANVLGTINQTLQTLFVAERYRGGIPVAAIVLNDAISPTVAALDASFDLNADELTKRCGGRTFARLGWQAHQFEPVVEWNRLSNRSITFPTIVQS